MSHTLPGTPRALVFHVSKHLRKWAIPAIAAVLIASTFDGLSNLALKQLIDAIVSTHPDHLDQATHWAIAFVSLFCGGGFIWRVSGFFGMQWITRSKAYVYNELFSHLTHHSAEYFNNRFAGALVTRVSNVAEGTGNIINTLLWNFLQLSMISLVGVITLWQVSSAFSGILLAWIATYATLNFYLVRKRHVYSMGLANASSKLRGMMVDSATNIAAVHQNAHQPFEISYVHSYIEKYRIAHLKNWIFSEWILVMGNVLQLLLLSGMLALSLFMLRQSQVTVGDMALIISVIIQIIRHLFSIGNEMNRLMDEYGQVSEGLHEILQAHEIVDTKDADSLIVQKGKIEFKNIHFSYGNIPVFQDFNLLIPAGHKVGIVGRSGAGKTSLTALLLRQYDIQSGDILIDEQCIQEVSVKSIRKHIALVPQDTSLFHRTIRENIRYGRLDATDEEVEVAAKLAQAESFIEVLPHKYDTLVGERGVKLSGGQRQRIAIARAILKNAPILILDEATSALDSESEEAIQVALRELMKHKTVIAIAHRLSTLRDMDVIVVLDKGKVVEMGPHEELVQKGGIYAQLWESQVSGFIQE